MVRDEVRGWIADNWADDLTVREWWRRLAEAGLAMPSWPAPYGREWSAADARVVTEELAAVGAVAPPQGAVGTTLAGPTLLAHGTPEQQARHLWPLLRGEESWCQLFSEPGAGSDLASLATRAVRDGDGWVVDGQKVWNSAADVAERGMLLARTDPDAPKHAGLTYFLVDMRDPGVETRPLRQMNGESHFCETFLTEVRVSADDVVGSPGDGWGVAQTTLRAERAMVAGRAARGLVFVPSGARSGFLDRVVGELRSVDRTSANPNRNALPARQLVALAREQGVERDPHVRQRLARYWTLTEINRYTQLRLRAEARRGTGDGRAASLTKLMITDICQASREVTFAILGAAGMLWGADAPHEGELHVIGLSGVGTRIGGGTDEIQRNVIAERALGLPREPQVDRDVPWRELRVGTQR